MKFDKIEHFVRPIRLRTGFKLHCSASLHTGKYRVIPYDVFEFYVHRDLA